MNTLRNVESLNQSCAINAGAKLSLAKLHQMQQSLRGVVEDVNEQLAIVSLQVSIDRIPTPINSILYRVLCTGEAAASDRSALVLLTDEADTGLQISVVDRQLFWTFDSDTGHSEQMIDRVLGVVEHLQSHPT